ncbi:MAG TPA: hypothetical protein VFD07_00800 [Candidatus Krumholzibacteria bacterium]|nr:hypothetical protein [Candidatus Krumholzibacteria bacterium]
MCTMRDTMPMSASAARAHPTGCRLRDAIRRSAFWGVLLLALVPTVARSTPVYSARAGRTCDNCHLTPNTWVNPKLFDRKCSLSCQACHVDPSGGGMRNASGRFYQRATLPAVATSPRPTQDWDRDFLGLFVRKDHATTYTDSLPQGPASAAQRTEPQFAPKDIWALGRPLDEASVHAFFQGRYGVLQADPALRFGWDLRLATYWAGSVAVFPMQADANVTAHPLEHFTLLANVGVRARAGGFRDTRGDPRTPYFRELYVLLHEAPMQTYVKVGRFLPAFGLRLDDHTALTRRLFELDASLPETRVTGIELGLAPNYPFASISYFAGGSRTEAPPSWNVFEPPEGHGAALHLGWRDEGWSLGGSVLARRRPLAHGGDATSVAVFATFNPWKYWRNLPLTWLAEVDVGSRTRSSGQRTQQLAFHQEIDWLAGNGVNFLLAQDWSDADTEVADDHDFRLTAGIQFTPAPGVALDTRGRLLVPAGDRTDADFIVQLRLYN